MKSIAERDKCLCSSRVQFEGVFGNDAVRCSGWCKCARSKNSRTKVGLDVGGWETGASKVHRGVSDQHFQGASDGEKFGEEEHAVARIQIRSAECRGPGPKKTASTAWARLPENGPGQRGTGTTGTPRWKSFGAAPIGGQIQVDPNAGLEVPVPPDVGVFPMFEDGMGQRTAHRRASSVLRQVGAGRNRQDVCGKTGASAPFVHLPLSGFTLCSPGGGDRMLQAVRAAGQPRLPFAALLSLSPKATRQAGPRRNPGNWLASGSAPFGIRFTILSPLSQSGQRDRPWGRSGGCC